ncbi:hypothetical protein CXB51_029729 [Gossypium anomalum]|uniref:Uncharacterized protein n=1 Tax=Gossypium anomalum TaxID=47600 RepID=A0A8J5YFI5_9ROSI|nr:hypothetical protein CXB51_029729 [Gossypium anomalum]
MIQEFNDFKLKKLIILFQMATISYFVTLMLIFQGLAIFSSNIPIVEASRGLSNFENLIVSTSPPSETSKRNPSTPPSPRPNNPSQDRLDNRGRLAGKHHD